MRMILFGMLLAVALPADDLPGGLKLVPSAPLRELVLPKRDVAPVKPIIRPGMLTLLPPSDPIYLVEESVDIAGEWRTYRHPKVDAFSKDSEGVALQGYDVISYREKLPQKGLKSISYEANGVTWWFSSTEHRNMFASDVNRFIPEYGGFCAYAVGKGYPATADPLAYFVNGDKLYLFFNRVALKVWEEDWRVSISKADRNWPKLHISR